MSEALIPATGGLTILGLLLSSLNSSKKKNEREDFEPSANGGTSGFGFTLDAATYPMFINFYPQNLGQDFNLFGLLQRLKYQNQGLNYGLSSSGVPISNVPRGIFTNTGHGQSNRGRAFAPVILCPGLGASKIFAKWNKSDPSQQVVSLDAYGNFEVSEKWRCRQVQEDWTQIWFPESISGLGQYCWQGNSVVYYAEDEQGNGSIVNPEGVTTIVPHFGTIDFQPGTYMQTLVEAFEALGYMKGTTLFGASYDFRKICSPDILQQYTLSLKKLIERSVSINQKKAILVAHSLGANLINYFLGTQSQEWKDRYIECFVSFSGAYGGCPKALRTILSGQLVSKDPVGKQEQRLIRQTTPNYAGLQWLLPAKSVYKNEPIVHFQEVSYRAEDSPELLMMAGYGNAGTLFTKVVEPIQKKAMEAPGVEVFSLCGANLNTETSYMYQNSLEDDPTLNYPYYQTDVPYNNSFNFYPQPNTGSPDRNHGDGTIPKFALEIPLQWSKKQKQPVHFRFYDRAEHTLIMSMDEPVRDLMEMVMSKNGE